jgi:hypothetical protein
LDKADGAFGKVTEGNRNSAARGEVCYVREDDPHRHPELVSGSISQQAKAEFVEGWLLKQVQHDGVEALTAEPQIVRFAVPPKPPNTYLANRHALAD